MDLKWTIGYVIIFVIAITVLCLEMKYGNYHDVSPSDSIDTDEDLLKRIDNNAEFLNHVVHWRISFFLAVVCSTIFFFLASKCGGTTSSSIPHPAIFFLTTLVIMLPLYYYQNFKEFHLIRDKVRNIRNSTNVLRERYNVAPYYG